MDRVLFSSASFEWSTPQNLFDDLDHEFHFTLDACASSLNYKVSNYYSLSDNSLDLPWSGVVWCNPPYGRDIKKWIIKACSCYADVVVMLLPARTDTIWFHDYLYNKHEIRFLKGRLHFNNSVSPAPFPSMIAIIKPIH